MTLQQIAWAKSHDWYLATLASNDGVLVLDDYTTRDGARHQDQKVFHDYRSLRDWAGY